MQTLNEHKDIGLIWFGSIKCLRTNYNFLRFIMISSCLVIISETQLHTQKLLNQQHLPHTIIIKYNYKVITTYHSTVFKNMQFSKYAYYLNFSKQTNHWNCYRLRALTDYASYFLFCKRHLCFCVNFPTEISWSLDMSRSDELLDSIELRWTGLLNWTCQAVLWNPNKQPWELVGNCWQDYFHSWLVDSYKEQSSYKAFCLVLGMKKGWSCCFSLFF